MSAPRQPQRRADGQRQCTATSKRSHERCKAIAMRGVHVCRHHGGRQAQSSIGPLNPNFSSGRHSRWMHALPSRYSADYVAALRDPGLLSLEHDIAITDARLAELLAQLSGSTGTWADVQATYDALIVAMQQEDPAAIRLALVAMRDLVHGNITNDKQWREWSRLIERKRRLVESERRHLAEQELFLSREQAMAYAHALLDAVTRHVFDRDVLERIATDLHTLTTAGTREADDDDAAIH